ncbi:MAG: helix-turn-helix domain-containing protein [Coriobacteriia bacterium]|nr:helix-turn-helix domain-containing protein [Coriobacteriia bacterium]
MARASASVGANVRAARRAAGISLAALSEAAAISKGYLSQIENGRVGSPTGAVLTAVAGALGTSVDSLIGPTHAMDQDTYLAEIVRENGWSYGTARMLASVDIDGLKPESVEDYRAIYDAIRSTLQNRHPDVR